MVKFEYEGTSEAKSVKTGIRKSAEQEKQSSEKFLIVSFSLTYLYHVYKVLQMQNGKDIDII